MPRHLHHHADHAEGGEADRGPHQRGLGERARVVAHRHDRADGHAGYLGLVAHRGVGDDLLAGVQHGVRVEQAQPQHGRTGQGFTRPGHRADLAAARQLHAHHGRGVTGQEHGRGIRAHLGDQADETRTVEHGLIRLDAVVAAHVERHRVREIAARRDDVGGHDLVAARVELQQLGELLPGRLVQLGRAERGAELGVLALQGRDGALRRQAAGDGRDAGRRVAREQRNPA